MSMIPRILKAIEVLQKDVDELKIAVETLQKPKKKKGEK